MGLDCFWKNEKDDIVILDFDPPLKLCGGLFSEHGNGSFRGQVYADIIKDLTGYSLYTELNEDDIKDIAEKLENADPEDVDKVFLLSTYDVKKEDFEDLKRMFKKYSQVKNIKLVPWY